MAMKTISTIFLVASLLFAVMFGLAYCQTSEVSRQEFETAHKVLNEKVDTLKRNQKKIIKNQKVIYQNQLAILDSIRAVRDSLASIRNDIYRLRQDVSDLRTGQIVIYDAITQSNPNPRTSKTAWQRLIDYFSN